MPGWVKLHRQVQANAVWTSTTPEQKVIFLTLLMMVNHAANSWEWEGEKYHVEPGQTITSLKSICKLGGKDITPQKVRTALLKFEKWGILTNKSTKQGRLITIINWGKYQCEEKNITNLLTVEQQTTNKQLTTNKNERMKTMKEDVSTTTDPYDGKEQEPSVKEVVSLYYQLLAEHTGETPVKQWARDCSILKKAADGQIMDQGADKIKERLRLWFKGADSYTQNKGYPLRLFISQYNSIIGKKPGLDKKLRPGQKPGESDADYFRRKREMTGWEWSEYMKEWSNKYQKGVPLEHRIIES